MFTSGPCGPVKLTQNLPSQQSWGKYWDTGGFPGGSDYKASACSAGDPGSIPGLGRSPGEGNGHPLQYSCLENSTSLTDWLEIHWWVQFKIKCSRWQSLEGSNRGRDGWMASSTQWTWVWTKSGRWWRIGKPGVLQSTGSKRVRHDWVTEQHWDTQRLATAWGSHMGSLTAEHIIFIILYATACPPTYEPYLSLSSS